MKFYDVYYSRLISKDKVIYTPNVPNIDVFENYKHKTEGKFTVGFIGGIRYLDQMKMLVDAAKMSDCKVLFAGAGGTNTDYEEILNYCVDKDWVDFTGKYDYNSQISELYGSVDCVYAVYDASNPNVRIALPNKLYEAVYCELPIIVAKNTYLSEVVESLGVGVSVAYNSTDELMNVLCKLKNAGCYEEIRLKCNSAKKELVNESWSKKLEILFRGE